MNHACCSLCHLAVLMLLTAMGVAQGVVLKPSGLVLFGSPAVSSSPAAVNFRKVCKATPEWRTIRAEGVREGTGRYDLLVCAMNKRVKAAVREVAERDQRDCVFRRRDLKRANGLVVSDLTQAVLRQLR